jgi:hypothetical protein
MSLPTKAFRRLAVAFALAAAIAAVTASVAAAGSPDAVDRYLQKHMQPGVAVCDVICRYNHERGITQTTDTLGGNGNDNAGGFRLITDTLAPGDGATSSIAAPTGPSGWPTLALAATVASCAMLVLLAGSVFILRKRRSVAA